MNKLRKILFAAVMFAAAFGNTATLLADDSQVTPIPFSEPQVVGDLDIHV